MAAKADLKGSKGGRRRERNCSVARTLEIMGDPWGFLILRAAFFGKRRFSEIQEHGAIPKKLLAARLNALVHARVLRKRPYGNDARRHDYLLTERGHALFLPAIALMHWGDRWMPHREGPPVVLRHTQCGKRMHAAVVCSHCREDLKIGEVSYRDGPGAFSKIRSSRRQTRRASEPGIYERGRPCSVARTLAVVADRWLFLIMREACFGARRFEEFRLATGIAPNILSDRLRHLVDRGLLVTRAYQKKPERFEYRLAPKGKSLYQPILAVMAWGDRWLAGETARPVILTHAGCGHDFTASVVCSCCRGDIDSHAVTYQETFNRRRGNAHSGRGNRVRRSGAQTGRPDQPARNVYGVSRPAPQLARNRNTRPPAG
jgi:DNA-binding HxlR family transcriptional regulator